MCLYLFIPERNALLSFEPGTGDQLLPEDRAAGYTDYLNWNLKTLDSLDTEPDDGGLLLMDEATAAKVNDDLKTAIPMMLEEAFDSRDLGYVILEGKAPQENGEKSLLLTISTAHLTPHTISLLETEAQANRLGLSVYNKDAYGWYIYLDSVNEKCLDGSDPVWNQCQDLIECIRFAQKQGADVLCFDCDAEAVIGLAGF